MRLGRANARYDLKGLKRPQTTSNDPKCSIDMKRSETVQFMSDLMRMDLTFFLILMVIWIMSDQSRSLKRNQF